MDDSFCIMFGVGTLFLNFGVLINLREQRGVFSLGTGVPELTESRCCYQKYGWENGQPLEACDLNLLEFSCGYFISFWRLVVWAVLTCTCILFDFIARTESINTNCVR